MEEAETAKNIENVKQSIHEQKYKDYNFSSLNVKSYEKYESPRYDSKY